MAKPINFIVIGDSAASGVGDSDSEGNYYGWGFHLAHAFKEPINYSNFARPGAQSREVRQIQLPRIIGENPDLVAVIVGGNDLLRNGFSPVEFEENLNFVLNEIESLGATSLLLELHDPTKLIPMPSLLRKVCTRRVELVNHTLLGGLRTVTVQFCWKRDLFQEFTNAVNGTLIKCIQVETGINL